MPVQYSRVERPVQRLVHSIWKRRWGTDRPA